MYVYKEINMNVAMDSHQLIGKNGGLPWPRIPADMSRFKKMTMGHSVIMGRKTWSSLPPNKKPLEGRENIVLSGNADYTVPLLEVITARSMEEALMKATCRKVFIIGGALVYEKALPYTDILHVTYVHGNFKGDVYFPPYNKSEWRLKNFETLPKADTATGTLHIDFAEYVKIGT